MATEKYLNSTGLQYFYNRLKTVFADKSSTYTKSEVEDLIPTKTSELTNDSNFLTGINSSMVTNALGYTPYNSSNPSGYQNAAQVQTAINEALADITGIDFEVVQTLPATGVAGVIYLVSNSGSSPNIYDEYIWLVTSSSYEKIGTTDVDLSGYWAKADLAAITTAEIDTIVA